MGGPCAGLGDPGADHEVGSVGQYGFEHIDEMGRVERGITVHEGNHVSGGRLQPGIASSAEAALYRVDDVRTERFGERCGSIGRTVVDDDRTHVLRYALEHPRNGRGLVEHGKYQVHWLYVRSDARSYCDCAATTACTRRHS